MMEIELVSADEAVARLMNVDFIPAGYALEDLLEGFVSEAQARYDIAAADPEQSAVIIGHRLAMKICEQRLEMAGDLLQALRIQVKNGRLIVKDAGASRSQNFNWEAVQDWALENFGLVVPESVVNKKLTSLGMPASIFSENKAESSTKLLDKVVSEGGISRTKSKHLHVTLYALAKTYANKYQKELIWKATDTLIIDAFAKEIVGMVSKLSGQQEIRGQGSESI
jgi:hypothetical protein